mgnify:CR=1 FL=1
MATEQQQATLRQLIKDVERYADEIYGASCLYSEWQVGEDWFYVDLAHSERGL